MCEADDRNKQALYFLENEWGSGRIDIGRMKGILRGTGCDHTEPDYQEAPLACTG